MKYLITLILITCSLQVISQTAKDSLYISYNKNMSILDLNERITLKFNLSGSDGEPSVYTFEIPNIGSKFRNLKFRDIKDEITDQELKKIELKTIRDFANLDFCELQYLFADTKSLFLIKKEESRYLKYQLVYQSTARG